MRASVTATHLRIGARRLRSLRSSCRKRLLAMLFRKIAHKSGEELQLSRPLRRQRLRRSAVHGHRRSSRQRADEERETSEFAHRRVGYGRRADERARGQAVRQDHKINCGRHELAALCLRERRHHRHRSARDKLPRERRNRRAIGVNVEAAGDLAQALPLAAQQRRSAQRWRNRRRGARLAIRVAAVAVRVDMVRGVGRGRIMVRAGVLRRVRRQLGEELGVDVERALHSTVVAITVRLDAGGAVVVVDRRGARVVRLGPLRSCGDSGDDVALRLGVFLRKGICAGHGRARRFEMSSQETPVQQAFDRTPHSARRRSRRPPRDAHSAPAKAWSANAAAPSFTASSTKPTSASPLFDHTRPDLSCISSNDR